MKFTVVNYYTANNYLMVQDFSYFHSWVPCTYTKFKPWGQRIKLTASGGVGRSGVLIY